MSDKDVELRGHLEDLENRLAEYHDALIEAVRERDELALDAAWGVSQAIVMIIDKLTNLVVAGAVWFGLWKLTGATIWPIVVAVVIALGIDHFRSPRAWSKVNKERLEERSNLARLPTWKSKAERLWK